MLLAMVACVTSVDEAAGHQEETAGSSAGARTAAGNAERTTAGTAVAAG